MPKIETAVSRIYAKEVEEMVRQWQEARAVCVCLCFIFGVQKAQFFCRFHWRSGSKVAWVF